MSPADRALVERDPALPGLAAALDATAVLAAASRAWPSLAATGARVTYVRYKPGTSCLAGAELATPGGPVRVTVKALGLQADDKLAKAAADGRAVVEPARRLVLRRFPDDGELRAARWLLDPERQPGALETLGLEDASLDVLAWKPERRLVVRAVRDGEPVAVVKCHEARGYARALATHRALAGVVGIPAVPMRGHHERRHAVVSPWVSGAVLQPGTDPLDAVRATGEALASLHAAPAALPVGPGAGAEQFGLQRLADDVAWLLPSLAPLLGRVVARLAVLREEEGASAAATHGDFYAKQVLLDTPGITFLDFDEAALGDGHSDLALFLAHVERDALRGTYPVARAAAVGAALLDGYRSRRRIDSRRLAWRTADALLRLAPHPFRHRHDDWPSLTEAMVQRARALLDTLPAPRGRTRPDPSAATRLGADPTLAGAAALLDPGVATQALGRRERRAGAGDVQVERVQLLRHKPGRRCLLAFDLSDEGGLGPARWLGKVRGRGTDRRAAAVHDALWQAGVRVIPEPLGTVAEHRMTLQRAVAATPLPLALDHGADPAWLGARVADALRALHAAPVAPGRAWTLDDELAVLRERLASLAARQPTLAPRIGRLLRRLLEVAGPLRHRTARALVHRDFYHDQVLVDGDRVVLVDLDLVAAGDPALDVGNFVAHLVEQWWRDGSAGDALPRLAAAMLQGATAGSPAITEDAAVRYAFLSLGRLLEIAASHDARRPYLPRLLDLIEDRLAVHARHATLSTLVEGARCEVA